MLGYNYSQSKINIKKIFSCLFFVCFHLFLFYWLMMVVFSRPNKFFGSEQNGLERGSNLIKRHRADALAIIFSLKAKDCISSTSTNALTLFSNILSTICILCSNNFTPLYVPQFVISPFPFGTNTLVFQSSGISFPPSHQFQ